MNWPSFYPPCCPPEDSIPATGVIFRLIRTEIPKPIDLKSNRELRPSDIFNVPECQACGLSVYTEIEGVVTMRGAIPAFRNRKIGFTELNETHGFIQKTTGLHPSHTTWWHPVECEPWTFFTYYLEG